VICEQLDDILDSKDKEHDDEATGYISGKDFMNDFATEEFLTKNIRVRPLSGATHKDYDDGKSDHISRN
jgi:hypothetical protein